MNSARFIVSAVALSACSLSALANPNLISNGSFESGNFVPTRDNTMSLSVGATDMTNWTVGTNKVAWIGPGNPFSLTASQGSHFLDLTDYAYSKFGGVSQSVSTTPGATYKLTFDLGSSSNYGLPSSILADAGTTQQSFSVNSAAINHWTSFSMTFTARSATTTIGLTGTQGPNYIGLDNVAVVAVPEPETYAMMLAGLGLMGFIARRRKQRVATA